MTGLNYQVNVKVGRRVEEQLPQHDAEAGTNAFALKPEAAEEKS